MYTLSPVHDLRIAVSIAII